MIEILELVAGAVSTKDLVPVLSHFCIYNGRIQGANGRVAIDAACPGLDDLTAAVPADRFLRAVTACGGEPRLRVNEDGTRLTISRGRFRATLSLLPASYQLEEPPTGERIKLPQPLLPVLRRLAPFVSTDASRPWACSVLVRNGYAYATNNVAIARVPLAGIDCVFPAAGIDEILRIDEEPTALRVSSTACWVEFSRCWLKMQLLQQPWPDSLARLIELMNTDALPELPASLRDDVLLLKPFFPDTSLPVILMGPEGISTQDGKHSAAIEGMTLPKAAFRLESLAPVLEVATHADFALSPSPWRGDNIVGLLSGVRV
jgi:hypothetical protein